MCSGLILLTSEYFEYSGDTSDGRDWYFAKESFRAKMSHEGSAAASDSRYFTSIDDRFVVAK